MQIVEKNITLAELKPMAQKMFGNLVKAVVDIERHIMAIDAELHADLELFLLENDSQHENLWGINIHPDEVNTPGFIVFDSMINIRPAQGNRSRNVENPQIQKIIIDIVNRLVKT